MTIFSDDFLKALDHCMLYEVGGFWNVNHPAVKNGLIDTPANRRAVGYVNDPVDRGGETKFGVAQRANPKVNVRSLTWAQAASVYHDKYWLLGKNDKLPGKLAQIHFDGCINHGPARANKFLQRALGVTEDGVIGPITLKQLEGVKIEEVIQAIARYRRDFYRSIVKNNASQSKFLNGWLRRINEVEEFALK